MMYEHLSLIVHFIQEYFSQCFNLLDKVMLQLPYLVSNEQFWVLYCLLYDCSSTSKDIGFPFSLTGLFLS